MAIQDKFNRPNVIYKITKDIDLGGGTLTIPEGCTLDFQGGSFSNGTIVGNNTAIKAPLTKIFGLDVELTGNWNIYGLKPEWFGADGTEINDTKALQTAINLNRICILQSRTKYYVSRMIEIKTNHSIIGNQAKIVASDNFDVNNEYLSVPDGTILYLHGRLPINGSENEMRGSTIRDIIVEGNDTLTGLYIGCENKEEVNQTSNVNYSVDGYNIKDVFVHNCLDGIVLGDCWNSEFSNIIISGIKRNGLSIIGQVVNNNFSNCRVYGGECALYINKDIYGTSKVAHRPEGCSFIGGFYGSANIGIKEVSSLAFYFTNLIIDLNTRYGVELQDATNLNISECYIFTNGGTGLLLNPISTKNNNGTLLVNGCYFAGNNKDIFIDYNQNGVNIINNIFHSQIEIKKASATVHNNTWNINDTSDILIFRHTGYDDSIVSAKNNTFKVSKNNVTTNIPVSNNPAYANDERDGIMTSSTYKFIKGSKICVEYSGGTTTYWLHIASTTMTGVYHNVRISGFIGTYSSPKKIDFLCGINGLISGESSNMIGYVKSSTGVDIYVKGAPAGIINLQMVSNYIINIPLTSSTLEPEGIVMLQNP